MGDKGAVLGRLGQILTILSVHNLHTFKRAFKRAIVSTEHSPNRGSLRRVRPVVEMALERTQTF